MRSTSRSIRKSGSVLDKSGYGAQKNVGELRKVFSLITLVLICVYLKYITVTCHVLSSKLCKLTQKVKRNILH